MTIKHFLEQIEAYHAQSPMGHPWLEEIRNLREKLSIAHVMLIMQDRDHGDDPEIRQQIDETKLLLAPYEVMLWNEGLRLPGCSTLLWEAPKISCGLPGLYKAGDLYFCRTHHPPDADPLDIFNL